MANQIQATVYQIDGNPLPSPIVISFLTSDIMMRRNSLSTIPEVQSSITYYPNTSNQLQEQTFFVSEEIGRELFEPANVGGTTQISASILEIDGDPQIPGGVTYCFPANAVSIWPSVNLATGVNSFIEFKNKRYSAAETEAELTAQANVNNALPYKVYTALLTQSGGSAEIVVGPIDGPLVKGITYTLVDITHMGSWDFSNVGGPVYPNETPFVATESAIPNDWNGVGGLSYNTGAPVATVLENTIGNIWWTYDNVGSYYAKSDDLFTEDKTFVLLTLGGGNDVILYGERVTSNTVGVYSDTFTESVELNGTFQIEIRVYN